MEVIVSHTAIDFDALASMVAAQKLYPEAKIVFAGKMNNNVKEFMSLHKDFINVFLPRDIELAKIHKLIVVDTRWASRIGPLKDALHNPDIEIHLYDHHPEGGEGAIHGQVEFCELIGAATTIFVKLIRARRIKLTPLEATILLIGIYEDTGCLTFTTTTADDASSVAYLLNCGANLNLLTNFIDQPLTEIQRLLLNELLISIQEFKINGVKVLVAKAQREEFVEGLALLTHKIKEIDPKAEAIFSIVEMAQRIYVVGRSKSNLVNVEQILQVFGGGGHEKAAAAAIKKKSLDEVEAVLQDTLKEKIKHHLVARDIMSTPVKTVDASLSIDEAEIFLLKYGHSGLPVLKDGKLVGVLSRRDIDKVRHHGLGHAPVKGYMTRNPLTVTPDIAVSEIQKILIKHDIGRLPVVNDDNELCGIVTRTDVLRVLHGRAPNLQIRSELNGSDKTDFIPVNVLELIETRVTPEIQRLLVIAGKVADEQQVDVYVVGGFVRDLFLKERNLDIDLVVEGDGIAFAASLAKTLASQVKTHSRFGTAILTLPEDGLKIDVATARREFYESPAALPQVEHGTIKQDLFRRDFTINAMAIKLNPREYGRLVDYFGAQLDIAQGLIRVMHNLSFIEDPTRIFRAIRFEQRYNFQLEKHTESLLREALRSRIFGELTGKRLRQEIMLLLSETAPLRAAMRMDNLHLLRYLHKDIRFDTEMEEMFLKAENILYWFDEFSQEDLDVERWLVYFAIALNKLNIEQANSICARLKFSRRQQDVVLAAIEQQINIFEVLNQPFALKPSKIYHLLENFQIETLLILMVRADKKRVSDRIAYYIQKLRNIVIEINGDDLVELGFTAGPHFKEALNTVKNARMDGLVISKEEELRLAAKFLSSAVTDDRDNQVNP